MMRSLASCIVVLVTLSNVSADGRQKRQVNSGPTSFCYYATWAKYSRLGPTAIDPFICTHLVLAFAEVKITGSQADLVAFDSSDENDVFPAMLGLKAQNPNLRVILAVGGWNHGTERFARVADNPALLRSFVTNTVDYLNKFSFDGLDVDWEFPTSKPQFTRFIRALKTEFDRPQNFNLILTSAMSAGEATIISGYDVPALAPLLDYMLLMSYDLHGGWEGKTGHNSPLFSSAGETSWRARLNTAWAAQEYFSRGMPRAKIVIGMTTYARRFTLRDRNVNGLEAAAAWWNQILNYPEVCAEFLPGSRIVWDSKARAHYAVKGDLWLSFDSVDSVREKTEWLMRQGYGGAMVWTLDQDDYANRCGQGFYPLLRTIKRGLFGPDGGPPVPSFPGQLTTVTAGPATTRTTRPGITTTTSRPATTRPPITGAVNCETAAPGNYPVPGNCGEFIQCANQRLFVLKCPPTLFYDPTFDWCNFEEQVRPNRPDCPW